MDNRHRREHTRRIGETLTEVFEISAAEDTTTDAAARILARRRVDTASAAVVSG